MFSKKNQQLVRSLEQKKIRKQHKLFVAEGKKIIEELINNQRFVISELFLTTKAFESLNLEGVDEKKLNCISIKDLDRLTLMSNSDFGLALVKIPENTEVPYPTNNEIFIILESVRDPGNLGTIIRIADWFGIKNIICSNDSVDVFSPKVIQASMGSFCRVNVFYTDIEDYILNSRNINIYGALLDGTPLKNVSLHKPAAIVLGNESRGISDKIVKLLNTKVTIPASPENGAESLNVAVATSILLYHFTQI